MAVWKSLFAVAGVAVAALVFSGCALMRGSDYPNKDITFIVPYDPGGSGDMMTRMLAQESEPLLKGKFTIVNKSGASGTLGVSEAIQSKPDGYTISMASMTAMALQPQRSKLPYGGPEDYQPIIRMVGQPNVLVVRSDSPWKTLDEFLADAKKRPGQIRVATGGALGASNLAALDLRKATQADVTVVPLSAGGTEEMAQLLGGHLEGDVDYPASVLPQLQAGKVRALAMLSKERNATMPDVPTAIELGYKLAGSGTIYYMAVGPKGMDQAVLDKLYKTFDQALKGPGYKKFADNNGMTVAPLGPADLAKDIKDWWGVYAEILKDMGTEGKK